MTTPAPALSSCAVFTGATMASVAGVPLPVSRLVRLKVIERPVSSRRCRAGVAVPRVVAVIDVAVEAVTAVKPWPSSDEQPATEPVWPIVAVGRAVVGGIVVVPVWAHGRNSYADTDLGRSCGVAGEQPNT